MKKIKGFFVNIIGGAGALAGREGTLWHVIGHPIAKQIGENNDMAV